MIRERCAQHLRIANQRASSLERRVEPFVWINRDRISLAQALQIVVDVRNGSRKATVGSIDVELQAVLLAERADFRQRIDCTCADRSRSAHYQKWHISCGRIRLDLTA